MKLELSLNGSLYSGEFSKQESNLVQYYRIPHDYERLPDGSYGGDGFTGGKVRDKGKPIPEVFRLYPSQTTPIYCKWIKMWWALNPLLDREHFELLLDDHWMLCNGTGWPSRYNCLTGEQGTDPDDKNKNPAFHESLIDGGAAVTGNVVDGMLWLNTLLILDQVPFDSTSLGAAKSWWEKNPDKWYYATTIAPSGVVTYTTFQGIDGDRQKLRIPILTSERVYIPLRELDRLPIGFFPPESNWKP
jgi:hypothetical protein